MNTYKSNENAMIRSRALTILFSAILSALILLPFITSAKGKSTAENNGKVYMHPLNKELHATVTLTDFGSGQYKLAIEGENGSEVYYDKVLNSTENFARVFDFSALQDGEYTLSVEMNNNVKQRHFNIEDGKIKVNYNTVAAPNFSVIDNKATVIVDNKNKDEYTIKIIAPEGQEVYNTFEKKSNIKKSFDFSKVEKGNYTVVVLAGNNEYTFDFAN